MIRKWTHKYIILERAYKTKQWFVPEDFMQYNTSHFIWYEANARISELYKKWFLEKCRWEEKRMILTKSHKKRCLYRVIPEKAKDLFDSKNTK